MAMQPPGNYPGFNYPANQLSKFLSTAGIVTLLLKNGEIIHYTPADISAFMQWLEAHAIENIKDRIEKY
jgi:hypothetical protein